MPGTPPPSEESTEGFIPVKKPPVYQRLTGPQGPSLSTDHGGIDETGPDKTKTTDYYSEAVAQARLAKMMIEDLNLTTDLAQAVVPILIQNLATLERKQLDYGPHNLIKFGVNGVVVRMSDKLERIINLRKRNQVEKAQGIEMPTFNEPLSDSFLDLANYAMMAYVMDRGLWPR